MRTQLYGIAAFDPATLDSDRRDRMNRLLAAGPPRVARRSGRGLALRIDKPLQGQEKATACDGGLLRWSTISAFFGVLLRFVLLARIDRRTLR
jgi:hypothetical protein